MGYKVDSMGCKSCECQEIWTFCMGFRWTGWDV